MGVQLSDRFMWVNRVGAMIKMVGGKLCCLSRMTEYKVRTNILYNFSISGILQCFMIAHCGKTTMSHIKVELVRSFESMYRFLQLSKQNSFNAYQLITGLTNTNVKR